LVSISGELNPTWSQNRKGDNTMPGPIVRSGPSQQYQQNWSAAFGKKKSESAKSAAKPVKKRAARKKKK
jgi:hypothetical protein